MVLIPYVLQPPDRTGAKSFWYLWGRRYQNPVFVPLPGASCLFLYLMVHEVVNVVKNNDLHTALEPEAALLKDEKITLTSHFYALFPHTR